MFPSPKKADSPLDPAAVRKKLTSVLKRAGCKHLRFHDLRHTFATNALEHGMDIKTLSVIIGHVSSATTLNVYTHVTDEMRQKAADQITGESPVWSRLTSRDIRRDRKQRTSKQSRESTASRVPGALPRSMTTSGRGGIPRK